MKKVFTSTQYMEGKLQPEWLGPYTIVQDKEGGENIVNDQYSKVRKREIPVDEVKLYFDQEIGPGSKGNKN